MSNVGAYGVHICISPSASQAMDVFITDNIITTGTDYGIDLNGLWGANITGNTVSDYLYGIALSSSPYCVVDSNTIQNNDTGIVIGSLIDNQITCNDILNNTYRGIDMCCSSTGNIINDNNISGNVDSGVESSIAVNAEDNW